MELSIACFGDTFLWHVTHETSDVGRHYPECTEGVFLGMRGTSAEIVLGTLKAIERA